jgi:hypothetical protein
VFTGLCLVLPASAAWQRNGPSMPTRSRPSPINFLQLQSSSECSHQFAIVPCPSHRPSSTTSPSFTTFHVPSSEALLEIRQKAGSVGCLGPSIATTPPSKLLCAPRRSRWFMALTPPPPLFFWPMNQGSPWWLLERDKLLLEIKDRLLHAQELKNTYNQQHPELDFQENNLVWLHLHHRLAATLTYKTVGSLRPQVLWAISGAVTNWVCYQQVGLATTSTHPQHLPCGVLEEI